METLKTYMWLLANVAINDYFQRPGGHHTTDHDWHKEIQQNTQCEGLPILYYTYYTLFFHISFNIILIHI